MVLFDEPFGICSLSRGGNGKKYGQAIENMGRKKIAKLLLSLPVKKEKKKENRRDVMKKVSNCAKLCFTVGRLEPRNREI